MSRPGPTPYASVVGGKLNLKKPSTSSSTAKGPVSGVKRKLGEVTGSGAASVVTLPPHLRATAVSTSEPTAAAKLVHADDAAEAVSTHAVAATGRGADGTSAARPLVVSADGLTKAQRDRDEVLKRRVCIGRDCYRFFAHLAFHTFGDNVRFLASVALVWFSLVCPRCTGMSVLADGYSSHKCSVLHVCRKNTR